MPEQATNAPQDAFIQIRTNLDNVSYKEDASALIYRITGNVITD